MHFKQLVAFVAYWFAQVLRLIFFYFLFTRNWNTGLVLAVDFSLRIPLLSHNAHLRRLASESEILTIDVKPGWKKGTKITFPDKGNEAVGQLPADLVFVIDEKPHDVYTREGNNLLVHQKIPLVDALAGTTVNLKTLDGRDLVIKVTDVISPGYELVVANEGMPIVKEKGKMGNLRIKFDVTFPSRLTSEQRATIRRALGG